MFSARPAPRRPRRAVHSDQKSIEHVFAGDLREATIGAVKLVVAIVSDADATKVTEALVSAGYPGPTRINTVGGFLRRGNATLLLGTDDERVESAIDVIRGAVEDRPLPEDPSQKRATIFVLNTARFIRV